MSDQAVDTKKAAEDLDDLVETQCSSGNWDYSEYMMGLANGLLLAKSCLTGETPEFLSAPEEWLCDKPDPVEPAVSVRCGNEPS